VDTLEDLELMKKIYKSLYRDGEIISLMDVVNLLRKKPRLLKINIHIKQKRI
jgi:spore coat polysaccharide biosynthesis protein SpsF (cytidylyltransferase family)